MAKNRNSIAKQIHLERLADDSHNRAKVKTQPAKKAKRKAAPKTVHVVWWQLLPDHRCPIVFTAKPEARSFASAREDTEIVTYHREVLPRTRTRKGER
jgi:methionyl-tRNA formyltransferase